MLFFDDGGERAVIEPDPADVGELGPLHDGSTAVSAAIADMVENDCILPDEMAMVWYELVESFQALLRPAFLNETN